MCASTHEYHLMLGKKPDFATGDHGKILPPPPPPTEPRRLLEITEHFCYYPPPLNHVGGSGRPRNNSAATPPTESRRLLEITEKTQEIQQPQLGSSAISRP